MARSFALVLGAALVLTLSVPAAAAVGYTVTVEAPGSVAQGSVTVRARVSGGVGDAMYAAYHVRPGGGWQEGRKVLMERVEEGVFEARSRPWNTAALPNGTYQLEVRVWGDVPPYRSGESGTFAQQVVSVDVTNPPPAPSGLRGPSGLSSANLVWNAVRTASRADFAGYRVLRKQGSSCAGTSGYRVAGTTAETGFRTTEVRPGIHCFRVVALRTGPAGVVASPPSEPVRIRVVRGGGTVAGALGLLVGSSRGAVPPAPPPLRGGELIVSDGEYEERLPYGSHEVTLGPGSEAAAQREPGLGGTRQTATAIAGGLILAVAALLIRRFLATAPER